jgi:serine/threonine protein kinase
MDNLKNTANDAPKPDVLLTKSMLGIHSSAHDPSTIPGTSVQPLRVFWPEESGTGDLDHLFPATPLKFGMLDQYELLEEIAEGGMGVVYKARDTKLDRIVALKTMRVGALAKPDELLRFQRESKAQAQLRHPSILPVLDAGVCDGMHYFTMPYVAGGCLSNRRREYPRNHRGTAELVAKVADAVHHAHQHGILHRDLKPGNILLDEQGNPLLVDFGLAKVTDSSVLLSRADQIIGTPAYMAPEQATLGSDIALAPQTDVWGLGVLLYELITGELPFSGLHAEDVVRQVRQVDPPAPHALNPDVSADLEAVVLHCLEKETEARYPTAAAVAADLRRWLESKPVQARRTRRNRSVSRFLRRKVVLATAAVLVAALCTGLALFPFGEREPQVKAPVLPPSLQLIDDQGQAHHKSVLRGGVMIDDTDPKKGFVCTSPDCSMIELMRGANSPAYRIYAEMKYVPQGRSRAGFYFGHQSSPTSKGPYMAYAALTLGEHPDERQKPQAWYRWDLFARLEKVRGTIPQYDLHWGLVPTETRNLTAAEIQLWRKVIIEVRGNHVQVIVDGKRLDPVTNYEPLHDIWKGTQVPRLSEFPRPFDPSGGFGLLIERTQAAFRNVTFTPLP